MVDVSIEALQTIKNALTTFQSNINGISFRAVNDANNIIEECKLHINQTKAETMQIEARISDLNKRISDLEDKIERAKGEYNDVASKIIQIGKSIHSLNSKISILDSKIGSLRSKLINTDDAAIRQQIQEKINDFSYQISKCEGERNRAENELKNSERKKNELQQVVNSAKYQRLQCENELSIQKNRSNKMKGKLERLNTTYNRVEVELNDYVAAAKKFERSSANSTHNNINSVDKCIESIEQYLSTAL